MGKDKTVMVVKADALFGNSGDYFEGFRPAGEVDYLSRILSNHDFMIESLAEEDPSYREPIAYCLLINSWLGQVFAYQRSKKDEEYTEKRLQGKWSWGLGGHIERIDAAGGNPILSSRLREMRQEARFGAILKTDHLGYLNCNESGGNDHFGLLFAVRTNSGIITPKDPEISEGQLRSPEELESMLALPDFNVEEWSQLSFGPLKSYLEEL